MGWRGASGWWGRALQVRGVLVLLMRLSGACLPSRGWSTSAHVLGRTATRTSMSAVWVLLLRVHLRGVGVIRSTGVRRGNHRRVLIVNKGALNWHASGSHVHATLLWASSRNHLDGHLHVSLGSGVLHHFGRLLLHIHLLLRVLGHVRGHLLEGLELLLMLLVLLLV